MDENIQGEAGPQCEEGRGPSALRVPSPEEVAWSLVPPPLRPGCAGGRLAVVCRGLLPPWPGSGSVGAPHAVDGGHAVREDSQFAANARWWSQFPLSQPGCELPSPPPAHQHLPRFLSGRGSVWTTLPSGGFTENTPYALDTLLVGLCL